MERDGVLDRIEAAFDTAFDRQGMKLPQEALDERKPGQVCHRAWQVNYVWGQELGEPFLEFLAFNRFTGERRGRIHASGRVEDLPVPSPLMVFDEDTTEEEQQRIERQYQESWRQYHEALQEHGLLASREELGERQRRFLEKRRNERGEPPRGRA